MRELFIKPLARLDLLEIWHHIAKDNVGAAIRVGDEIDAAIRDLIRFPGKGHRRQDVKDVRLRFWGVYSYLIAHRYDDETLMIVRVVHGARNLRALFRKRS